MAAREPDTREWTLRWEHDIKRHEDAQKLAATVAVGESLGSVFGKPLEVLP